MITIKMIGSIRTKQITPVGVTGEEGRDGVEFLALPAPSPCGCTQRSGEMGIIGRDGQELRLHGEGGGSSPRKRRQKTPHYVRAPMRRGL